MSEPITAMLTGGHPNSLGRTQEVVDLVLADPPRLDELFGAIDSDDEVVRLRVGDALEKVCRDRPEWFLPHVDQLLTGLGEIVQPSVQWHVAQMLAHVRDDLTHDQADRATALLQHNLICATDWIVLNVTMDVLTRWADNDQQLTDWLRPVLDHLRRDPRKSVAKRAGRRLADLAN